MNSGSQAQSEPPITIFCENGEKYTGRIKNGKKNDENATLYFDNFLYEGAFADDMKHGHGSITSVNLQSDSIQNEGLPPVYKFEGVFQNDKKEGEG